MSGRRWIQGSAGSESHPEPLFRSFSVNLSFVIDQGSRTLSPAIVVLQHVQLHISWLGSLMDYSILKILVQ